MVRNGEGRICCFCHFKIRGTGQDASPIREGQRCCEECYTSIVVPQRYRQILNSLRKEGEQ